MNIKSIAIHIDFDSGYTDPFRVDFNLRTRFINHFISSRIRKRRISTDGSFNMISVVPTIDIKHKCRIVGDKALQVRIDFDKEEYERLDEFGKNGYCLALLDKGYRIADNYKKIPLPDLLQISEELKECEYKNEWLHKKKTFKQPLIQVLLTCCFTPRYFQLIIRVIDISSKADLISGVVIRTLPDEVHFAPLFKDIIVDGQYLIITEFQGRPKFKFLLSDIYDHNFHFEVTDVGLVYRPLL
jgi:hypothetical protein